MKTSLMVAALLFVFVIPLNSSECVAQSIDWDYNVVPVWAIHPYLGPQTDFNGDLIIGAPTGIRGVGSPDDDDRLTGSNIPRSSGWYMTEALKDAESNIPMWLEFEYSQMHPNRKVLEVIVADFKTKPFLNLTCFFDITLLHIKYEEMP